MSGIKFHQAAKNEFFAARDYYDDLVYGLGKIFINETERYFEIIKSNPLAYPIIKKNVRKAVMKKFPYSILYRLESNKIYILAIANNKRKPFYRRNR